MEPSNDVIRSFLISHKLLLSYFEGAFAAANAPSIYETALLILVRERQDGRLSMEAARKALGFTRSGVSRLVDRMVRAGWLERRDGEQDRRTAYVSMTISGGEALQAAEQAYGDAFAPAFLTNLNEDELVQLMSLLDRLSAGLASQLPTATK